MEGIWSISHRCISYVECSGAATMDNGLRATRHPHDCQVAWLNAGSSGFPGQDVRVDCHVSSWVIERLHQSPAWYQFKEHILGHYGDIVVAWIPPTSSHTSWALESPGDAQSSGHQVGKEGIPTIPIFKFPNLPLTYWALVQRCKGAKVPRVSRRKVTLGNKMKHFINPLHRSER